MVSQCVAWYINAAVRIIAASNIVANRREEAREREIYICIYIVLQIENNHARCMYIH
jgi:hypothetical protein